MVSPEFRSARSVNPGNYTVDHYVREISLVWEVQRPYPAVDRREVYKANQDLIVLGFLFVYNGWQ